MVQSHEPGPVEVVALVPASIGQDQPGLQALMHSGPLEGTLNPLTTPITIGQTWEKGWAREGEDA